MPAQAAIADYLQHGGYDRHLRKLRYALEEQQSAMLAAIARYFPAQTRVSQPAGGYFLWLELPEQMDSLKLFQMALAQASASRRGRSSRRPGGSGTAFA
jgi:DNA-binding transcriptional MocR family regulator